MSHDPYASGSEPPEHDYAEPRYNDSAKIKSRVQAPAIALIVVGVLNLLGTGWSFFNTAMMTLTPANQLHQQLLDIYQAFPQIQAELNKKTPDELKNQALFFTWSWVVLGLVGTVLILAGGIRMVSLKNYSLGICAAICAAIPCVSCLSCCGVGEAIGIWALIVLLNAEVKEAFR